MLDSLILSMLFFDSLMQCEYTLNSILWWPSGRHDKLISIDEENLSLWSLDLSKKAAQVIL